MTAKQRAFWTGRPVGSMVIADKSDRFRLRMGSMQDDAADKRLLAEMACIAAIHRFAACQDAFDDEGVLSLVAENCVWRGPADAEGHAAIRARLAARSRLIRNLHVVSGTIVDFENENSANARTIVTVYRLEGQRISPPGLPHTLGIYHDRFCRNGERWLFVERRLTPAAQA